MTDRIQDLSRFKLPPGFRGRSAFTCQLWWIAQDTVFKWSPQFAFGFRRMLLRCFGARIGRAVLIRPTVRITYPWKVSIGEFSWIGDHAELYSLDHISIGSHAVVSQRSYLCSAEHDFTRPDFPIVSKPIVISDEAWVCADVFIMPGVKIGRGAVVGARSLVTRDIKDMMVASGSPARETRMRLTSDRIDSRDL